jgi:hypothetical protein
MRIHVFKDELLLACVWPCQDEQNAQHKTAVSGLVLLKKKHQQYSDRQLGKSYEIASSTVARGLCMHKIAYIVTLTVRS